MSSSVPPGSPAVRSSTAKPYDLLVFDWDGTIVDSLGSIVACAESALADLGVASPGAAALRSNVGLGLDVTATRVLPHDHQRDLRPRWVERYRHHWFAGHTGTPTPIPGAVEAVRELAKGDALLAVATSKGRGGLDRDLAGLGLEGLFAATRTVDEAPSKPSPQMLLDILEQLGVRAEKALMVGDTTHDMETARNAEVDAVGVLTGAHDREALEGAGPLAVLDGTRDLPAWLKHR